MWQALLKDLQQQTSPGVIAAKFHIGLAQAIGKLATSLCQHHHIKTVVLSGGVFQNLILLEQLSKYLKNSGINTLTHSLTPCNDGGLSLGQAVIAAAKLIKNNSKYILSKSYNFCLCVLCVLRVLRGSLNRKINNVLRHSRSNHRNHRPKS